MNDQGIGAPVRRKEYFRFLTRAGNDTDDINRRGQLTEALGDTCASRSLAIGGSALVKAIDKW
jgi:hypothetical protein